LESVSAFLLVKYLPYHRLIREIVIEIAAAIEADDLYFLGSRSRLLARSLSHDRRSDLFHAANDKDGIAADQTDFGLAIFGRAQIGDIGRDHHIVSAARRKQNELHDVISLRALP
jgi:hypothetical protein